MICRFIFPERKLAWCLEQQVLVFGFNIIFKQNMRSFPPTLILTSINTKNLSFPNNAHRHRALFWEPLQLEAPFAREGVGLHGTVAVELFGDDGVPRLRNSVFWVESGFGFFFFAVERDNERSDERFARLCVEFELKLWQPTQGDFF